MKCRILALICCLLLPLAGACGQTTPTGNNADHLAQALKPILISAMPGVLYEKSDNWGHQVLVPVGIKWRGLKPQVAKSLRDHGEWRKIKLTAQDLARTMDLRIYDIKKLDAERNSFKVFLAFQMGVLYDQQNWESGVRLWSGSVRARAQVKLDLDCESTLRIEMSKEFVPDITLRLRVAGARIGHDKLVIEHIAGIGGTGAQLVGAALHDSINRWRPSIERDLLQRASSAIVKSADTKEIRLSFGDLAKTK